MRLLVRGVSERVSTTSPIRQSNLLPLTASTLVPPVSLLVPRVTAVVVAQRLPEPLFLFAKEPQAAHPFGALPEVQVWYEQPRGAAVLWGAARPHKSRLPKPCHPARPPAPSL